MKKSLALFLFAIISISLHSQNKQFKQTTDSVLKLNLQNHIHLDTIWVLDSSLRYQRINSTNELTYQRTYKVLLRNDAGNLLTSLDWESEDFPDTTFQNSVYDSIIYFNGIDIKEHYSNAWNSVEQSWIHNKYKNYETPDLPKEIFSRGFSNSMQQYYNGKRNIYDNANGHTITTYTDSYVHETGNWVRTKYKVFSYDEQGNDTLHMYYKWNYGNPETDFKYQRSFESNQLALVLFQLYVTQTNSWQNIALESYSYNNLGQLDTTIIYSWSTVDSNWIYQRKTIYSYDNINRLTNRLRMYFRYDTQEISSRRNLQIDYLDGNKTETLRMWTLLSGSWKNQEKHFTSYITDEIIDTLRYDRWNTDTQHWEPKDLTTNKFDNHLNVIESSTYFFGITDWEIETKTDYFWSPFIPNAINENSTNSLAVYPNPASTQVTFDFQDKLPNNNQEAKLQIFSISGQKITEISVKEGKAFWDCSTAKTGLYVYSTVVDGLVFTGKLIVR